MNNPNNQYQRLAKLFGLGTVVCLAIGERAWFDLGWNVELVTLATFLAAAYGGRRWSWTVPLTILAVSDVLLGNTSIALFTWSAYAMAGPVLTWVNRSAKTTGTLLLTAAGSGIGVSLWFYLWTNFGVWLLDVWGMYPRTMQGLAASYINGLPFLRNQLQGNIVLVPVGVAAAELIIYVVRNITQALSEQRMSIRLK